MNKPVKKFVYKARPVETYKKRSQGTSLFDTYVKDGIQMMSVKAGKHRYRILPPTWEGADHYGYDIYMTYGIGPDKQAYLSLNKMKKAKDPLWEERSKALAEGREDDAKALTPGKRVLVWAVDRKAENEGPKLWAMPTTVDKDITARVYDEITGEVLSVDDPFNGYDVIFSKDGEGLKTRYTGIEIARSSTKLSDDEDQMNEWLDFVQKNPIPEILNFYSYDHIKSVFNGGVLEPEPVKDDVAQPRRKPVVSTVVEETEEDSFDDHNLAGNTNSSRDIEDETEVFDDEDEEPAPAPVKAKVEVKPATSRLRLRRAASED